MSNDDWVKESKARHKAVVMQFSPRDNNTINNFIAMSKTSEDKKKEVKAPKPKKTEAKKKPK